MHFAQCVEEIHEQLPLEIKDSQFIIVAESLEGVKKTKEFDVRPKYLNRALDWLIINNRLYHDVDVVDREARDYDLGHVFVKSIETDVVTPSSVPNSSSARSITSSEL